MTPRPTAPPPTPLGLAPRTIFVTGKGGVGKTTVAAALALAYRDAGARTLLVEIEGQEGAASLIASKPIGYEPVTISPKLAALRIDVERALREYARLQLKVRMIADRMVTNPVISHFAAAAPGLKELLVLGKLWSLSKERSGRGARYEAIIVDAPATGHGLSLLATAGSIARTFPVGPVAHQARQVDAFIRQRARCAAVLVGLAEEVAANEAVELHEHLERGGVHVGAVVVNGLLPHRLEDGQAAHLEHLATTLDEDDDAGRRICVLIETALYEHTRAQEQRAQLDRLDELAGGSAAHLPYLYSEHVGRAELSVLAGELA